MNKNLEVELRSKILLEIDKTKKIIADYKEMTIPEGLDSAVGRISRMDAINNKSVTLAALRVAEQKLTKLRFVESQIGKKGFGECTRCGKTIPTGRIILMPQSTHCINCAK